MGMNPLSRSFAALADDTRLAIVEQLIRQGELPAGALVAQAGITAPAVSRHLKVLRQAGLVRQRVDGPRRLYSADPAGLRRIADWAMSRRDFWQAGLDRLDTAISEDIPAPDRRDGGWTG